MLVQLLLLAHACSGDPVVEPVTERPMPSGPDVIFVTLDTTRADALGVYGGPPGSSPFLDDWARKGVRFQWAFSHVPTTLSSHSSMFTGLDPHEHGVPSNGFPLREEVETLAERLFASGWDTLGVVAASVVSQKMGMAQGFRLFDGETRTDMGPRMEDRGDRVTRRALSLLEQRDPERPLFAWFHYYDAHSPYDPPSEFVSRFVEPGFRPRFTRAHAHARLGDRIRAGDVNERELAWLRGLYQGEVAWMDHQIQRLFAALEAQGLLENAIVIFVGDHGEMFAETRPFPLGHGFDVDLWVSRVPLFWVGTGSQAQSPRRVDASVKLSDLAPTLLAQLGLPDPAMGSGQDLQPLLRGEPLETDPIFLEATKARAKPYEDGWNNLMKERGVIHEGHVLFRHPGRMDQNGLFLVDENQTPVNEPGRAKALGRLLTAWDAKAPGHRTETMDAETKEALRALGYIE